MDRDWLLDVLADAVVAERPRVFGIHGVYRRTPDVPILGWGLQFTANDGAIFRQAGDRNIHLSDTADRVLETHSIIGDVRLTWLDGPWADPESSLS